MGWGTYNIIRTDQHCEGVRSNVISITRGGGVSNFQKKLEWPLMMAELHAPQCEGAELNDVGFFMHPLSVSPLKHFLIRLRRSKHAAADGCDQHCPGQSRHSNVG